MCGIAGVYNFRPKEQPDQAAVIRMRDYLAHRGPDSNGLYFSPDKQICLVNTRLSIIDLSPLAAQPMSDKEGTVWLSFNGEIYNYRELRDELKAAGSVFKSDSDTEAVICGYKQWGLEGLLKRLRGMFAFALYDLREKPPRFIVCRDRFGIKPLYYYRDERAFVFASEVGAIVNSGVVPVENNSDADMAFLIFGYVPAPLTTVKNVFSLPEASYLVVDSRNSKPVRYYDLLGAFCAPKQKGDDLYRRLRDILKESVRMHLVSDAPLGIFLSGGIDSCALAALASGFKEQALSCISVIFEEKGYCESDFQRAMIKESGINHRQVKITADDFYGGMNDVFKAMDQPTCDGVNTYFVCRAAKEAGFKAVLSGVGSDEIFCGYDHFKRVKLLRQLSNAPKKLKSAFAMALALNYPYRKLSYLKADDDLSQYLSLRGLFSPDDIAVLLSIPVGRVYDFLHRFQLSTINSQLSTLDPIDWLSYMEMNYYLRDQLLKDTDFMGMYHSLEVRVPFLDHTLVDFVARVSPALKSDSKQLKPLLAKSLSGLLPDKVASRKKHGFVLPFAIWLKKQGRQLLSAAASRKGLESSKTDFLWRAFERSELHWSRIWALIVLGSK